jgi:hypothetical protein
MPRHCSRFGGQLARNFTTMRNTISASRGEDASPYGQK